MPENLGGQAPSLNKKPRKKNRYPAPNPYPEPGWPEPDPRYETLITWGEYMELAELAAGRKRVKLALTLNIVGFFICPLLFGLFALKIAKEGEELGVDADTAIIASRINIGLGIVYLVLFAIFFLF